MLESLFWVSGAPGVRFPSAALLITLLVRSIDTSACGSSSGAGARP
jgi:hypothetical protein